MTNSSTFAIALLCVLALACILVTVYMHYPVHAPLPNRAPTVVHTTMDVTTTTPSASPRNHLTIMATTQKPNKDVLQSFVESRSSTHLQPTGPNEPTLRVPYPDVSACPFLQQTNNQPAPASERTVPLANRPGSTCPRINLWWSDVCGVTSI